MLGQGLFVTGLGVSLGVVGAVELAPFLCAALYNVRTRDPWLMTLVTAVLALVALFAAAIPARRAAHVDPAIVLRGD